MLSRAVPQMLTNFLEGVAAAAVHGPKGCNHWPRRGKAIIFGVRKASHVLVGVAATSAVGVRLLTLPAMRKIIRPICQPIQGRLSSSNDYRA